MASSAGALTISGQAASVRRRLGPLAWVILEELALRAERCDGGTLSARVGVRDLAAALGMSKDTAARGLGLLVGVGMARRVVGRSRGRFSSCHYEVDLPAGVALANQPWTAKAEPRQPRSARASAVRSRHQKPGSQLTLIDQATVGNG